MTTDHEGAAVLTDAEIPRYFHPIIAQGIVHSTDRRGVHGCCAVPLASIQSVEAKRGTRGAGPWYVSVSTSLHTFTVACVSEREAADELVRQIAVNAAERKIWSR